jgi:hypothetical protein
MGTLSATLLTAPMFRLKLAWATGAPVLHLPLAGQCRTPQSCAALLCVP